jgi:hypothetical protein
VTLSETEPAILLRTKPPEIKVKWALVAFNHPLQSKSVLYRQDLTVTSLIRALENAIENGANLVSIRGYYVDASKRD